jgi:hypothetical protein
MQLALEKVQAVFDAKGRDYADDSNWRSNFQDISRQVGIAETDAVEVLIAVKQSRLRALKANGRAPTNEGVIDTVLDRAVYSMIALGIALEESQ